MKTVKYNPGFLTDDELIASFCVRTHEFVSIVEMLRECDKSSNPHRLVIGPRGCGKTSLLLRVAVEIRRDPALLSSFFPIVFAEESYEVATAGEFWLEALSRLADQAPCLEGEDNLYLTVEELRNTPDDRMLGKRCLGSLLDFSDRQEKRLILIVENLNMMFKDMSDPDAGWQLRQVLQTEPRIILLASATARFDEIDKSDHAFYDLFVSQTLRPLCVEECAVLWEHISGQHRPPETMRGLRILTGGNPRLLSIVARFGAELSFRDFMADLMELIDDLTEYFKSHIEVLAPQERRVYLALADLWEPASARQVATRTRLDTSQSSAQLRRLVERGVVEVVGGKARRKLYYLTERLYNIYYLLRRSRTPTPLIEALIRFMDAYYSAVQLKDLVSRMIRETDGLEPEIKPFHQAAFIKLIDLPVLAEYREELLSIAPEEFAGSFGSKVVSEDAANSVSPKLKLDNLRPITHSPQYVTKLAGQVPAEVSIKQAPVVAEKSQTKNIDVIIRSTLKRLEIDDSLSARVEAAKEIITAGISFLKMKRPKETIVACETIARQFDDSDTPQLAKQVANALLLKGVTLGISKQHDEEFISYDELVLRFGDSKVPAVLEIVAQALTTKARTLANLNRFDEAIIVCDEVVRRFGESEVSEIHEQVALALISKGVSLHVLGQPDKEIAAYDEVVHRFSGSDLPKIIEQVARAIFFKGLTLFKLNQFEETISVCDEIGQRFGGTDVPAVLRMVAQALTSKGNVLEKLNQPEKALVVYDEVAQQFGGSDMPELLEIAAQALFRKGGVLSELGNFEGTISVCDEIEQRFGDTEVPAVLRVVAQALTERGDAFEKLNQPEKALVVYDEVVQRFSGSDMPELLEIAAQALFRKGGVLSELGNFEETISVCDEIEQRFGDTDEPEMLVLVAHALANKGSMLGELDRLEEIATVSDEVIRQFGGSDVPEVFSAVTHAYENKVRSLVELNRPEQAIAVCREVAHQFGGSVDAPEICSQAARLLLDIGQKFDESNRFEEAAIICDEIAQQFGTSDEPDILKVVVQALTNKGSVLLKLNRFEEAIPVCDEVVRRFGGSNEPVMLEAVARVLVNKGSALMDLSRPEEAIATCDEVERRFGNSNKPMMLKAIAEALVHRGAALLELGRSEDMITVCDQLMQRFDDRNAPQFHTQVARMLIYKGLALSDLKQEEQAKAVWQELVQRFGTDSNPIFRHPVAISLLRLADSARVQGHLDEVINTVNLLFDRYDEEIYSCYQCEGYLIRSRAHLASNDLPQAGQDIKTALTLLPNCEFLLSEAIHTLIDFTVSQGAAYTNDFVQSSPSAKLLTPFTVALEKEMGREPKVARELEEVAEDIRKDIEKVRRAGNQQ